MAALDPGQAARRLPGIEGVWVFVAADLTVFGLFFVSFVRDRGRDAALFEQARQTLDADIGGVNTLILLTSSWFVALAVQAAQAGAARRIPRLLAWAAACGLAFAVLKVIEYAHKLRAGTSMLTNDFYMYYFTLTGIHLLHVAAGTVILLILWSKARAGAYGSGNCAGLESGATFWHMVDLLWVVIFPLLYLLK
ncbi:MAG: cytochrome c oxidase subunit 3 family protein [Betaproteobacteria bacterium]|nr:MAG: cytochrome c oxidase subunit 3 family protein [Betaproteobacteria bacterium]